MRRFATVELNASFYRWPRDASFASWRRRLPDGFALSVKAPRGLTHAKRLYAPEPWLPRLSSAWFVYFNNDGEGHAVRNATRLREFVGA
jgi:uncharacterized protein YecE (DUF72 family)